MSLELARGKGPPDIRPEKLAVSPSCLRLGPCGCVPGLQGSEHSRTGGTECVLRRWHGNETGAEQRGEECSYYLRVENLCAELLISQEINVIFTPSIHALMCFK